MERDTIQRRVFSFDVFDTVLTRIVVSPKDVFLLMQEQLHSISPLLPDRLMRSYWGSRVWAEFSARRNSPAEEITLTDIYCDLGGRYGLSSEQVQQLMALEMRIEAFVLVPIDGALQLVAEARRQGEVVFVSDMYLPTEFVRAVLRKFDLLHDPERIYISGELGVSKGSGRLFQRVLADYELSGSCLVHCGDNVCSDVTVPRRLGIQIHPSVETPSKCPVSYNSVFERARYGVELLRARCQMEWHEHV